MAKGLNPTLTAIQESKKKLAYNNGKGQQRKYGGKEGGGGGGKMTHFWSVFRNNAVNKPLHSWNDTSAFLCTHDAQLSASCKTHCAAAHRTKKKRCIFHWRDSKASGLRGNMKSK